MISIKDYAESRNVSQVAVRKQILRYQEDLKGHIIQEHRRRMLDDEAAAFLDKHRQPREIIIEKADEIAKKEIENLQLQLSMAQSKIIALQDTIISLKDQQTEFVRMQEQNRFLLEQKKENSQQIQTIQEELTEVKNELNSFSKSWFGFWRKK